MIKYNEAQNIRRTYEQIVKRLREERTGFDSHLKSLEDTMKGKDKDHEDLEILARDAVAARDASRAELETLRVEYEEFVRWTEDQLNEQRAKVKAREEMETKMQGREKARTDAALSAKGELDAEGENVLRKHYVAAVLGKAAAKRESHTEEDRVNTYESAFRRIKEATGVSDVNEIIQKFLTQEDTLSRLNDLAKESQARIEQLTEERKRIQQKVVDAKMKSSSTAGNRRIVDEFEQLLSEAKVKSERIRTKYERLTKVMINVKAGIDHLGDKIHMALGRTASPRVSTSNGPVIDSLKQCQKRLAIMLDIVRDKSSLDELQGHEDDQVRGRVMVKVLCSWRAAYHDVVHHVDGLDELTFLYSDMMCCSTLSSLDHQRAPWSLEQTIFAFHWVPKATMQAQRTRMRKGMMMMCWTAVH